MKRAIALTILATLAIPCLAQDQTTVPQQTPPGTAPAAAPAPAERPISWKLLIPNILNDQKRIWTFPARLAEGQNWIPTTAVLGTTAGLLALDPIEGRFFHSSSTFQGFNNVFNSTATIYSTIAAPVSLYAAGLIRKDAKMQHTALFAAEAVADSEVVATALKDITRRVRPAGIGHGGNYWDTWFESGGSALRGNGGFPSGHTIAAFSIATVVARRYRNHRWVPYAAYGLATLVGFSRLSLSAHFLSDVFVGGALGYSISRFAVLRQ